MEIQTRYQQQPSREIKTATSVPLRCQFTGIIPVEFINNVSVYDQFKHGAPPMRAGSLFMFYKMTEQDAG